MTNSSRSGEQRISIRSNMSNVPENIRVEYSIEATINTGNFQNVKPGYKLSATVPKGAKASEIRAQLKTLADKWLAEDIEHHQQDMRN